MKEIDVLVSDIEIEVKAKCVIDALIENEFNVLGYELQFEEQLLKVKYVKDGGSKRIKTFTFDQVNELITLVK